VPGGLLAIACFGLDLRLRTASDVLTGASIMTGFLFGFVLFAFQLRLRVTDDAHLPKFGSLRGLINRAFGRGVQAVVVSLATNRASGDREQLRSSRHAARRGDASQSLLDSRHRPPGSPACSARANGRLRLVSGLRADPRMRVHVLVAFLAVTFTSWGRSLPNQRTAERARPAATVAG